MLALVSLMLAGCRRAGDSTSEDPGAVAADAGAVEAPVFDPARSPARWEIDGTTVAAAPALPPVLARALREHGRDPVEVQDHIIVDINDDAQLDALVLLPAASVAGAFDHLVMLSHGESVQIHELAGLVDGAVFAVAVIPLVDGPTLVAAGPRMGSCERGPIWWFLRPTGSLLEDVGSIAVEPHDCAEAVAEIVFEREEDGRVSGVAVRHGDAVVRHVWDASLGSFRVAE